MNTKPNLVFTTRPETSTARMDPALSFADAAEIIMLAYQREDPRPDWYFELWRNSKFPLPEVPEEDYVSPNLEPVPQTLRPHDILREATTGYWKVYAISANRVTLQKSDRHGRPGEAFKNVHKDVIISPEWMRVKEEETVSDGECFGFLIWLGAVVVAFVDFLFS